jgi:chemotaxis signal transduction protein
MITMVFFRVGSTGYCMPVEATCAVRRAERMIELPDEGREVVGLLPGNPPLTVMSTLGDGGSHVLVVEAMQKTFGLLVDEVVGVRRVDERDIRHSPDGQASPLVFGTVECDGELALLADADALAGRL